MAAEVAMPVNESEFRTCSATGFKVHLPAEALIKANAVAAVVCILVGGTAALLIAMTRWPAVHLLPADWFYRLLTLHGLDMLVAWIVFFEVAGLYFGSTVLLNARLVKPKLGWFAFALMVLGGALINIIVLMGKADVMFTAYVPLKAHPIFYIGVILFAVGALIAVGLFFATIAVAKKEKTYEGSLPLVVYGLATAAIIATYTLLSGAFAFVPALFWVLGWIPNYDPSVYRNLFWSFGHPAQQINLAAMVAIWYALAAITTGAKPLNEKLSRLAFVLYLLFINLGSAHHLLVDPGLSFAYKAFNTSYMMYLAVLGSMIHAYSIPGAVEVALRKKGHNRGLLGWLRNAPWKEPGFSALVISMVLFGWIGGVTGVTLGTEQLNMVGHNTMRIPGHFHATVVAGTTTAFMAFTYYLIPLIFRRELKLKKWASLQPFVFGAGITMVSIGMITAGIQGVSRRHWDISNVGTLPGTVYVSLTLLGIGALIAVTGLIMYLAVVLSSVLSKKQYDPQSLTLVQAATTAGSESEAEGRFSPKGTFAIVLAFLMFFAAFYLANWWLLGKTWMVR